MAYSQTTDVSHITYLEIGISPLVGLYAVNLNDYLYVMGTNISA